MRTGDERLAMEKAQQAWSQTFQERQQTFSEGVTEAGLTGTYEGQQTQQAQQQQFAQGVTAAGLLGTYEGQQTLPAQQQAWAQRFAEQGLGQQGALSLLQAQAALQGPRDWQRYWQMSASAPQGLQSALSSLAGRYQFAPGYQGTPGPATLGSRTQDLLSGGNLGSAGQGATPQGGASAGTGQAGNAWQWDLQNWQRMSPSMQQGVLGAAEAGGAYGPDLERLLQQAAPRYTGSWRHPDRALTRAPPASGRRHLQTLGCRSVEGRHRRHHRAGAERACGTCRPRRPSMAWAARCRSSSPASSKSERSSRRKNASARTSRGRPCAPSSRRTSAARGGGGPAPGVPLQHRTGRSRGHRGAGRGGLQRARHDGPAGRTGAAGDRRRVGGAGGRGD